MSMEELHYFFASVQLPFNFIKFTKNDDNIIEHDTLKTFYEVVSLSKISKSVLEAANFKQTQEIEKALLITGHLLHPKFYPSLQYFQKINHFAFIQRLGCKDTFHQRMLEIMHISKEYPSFYPKSYVLPKQQEEFNLEYSKYPLWLQKPTDLSRGRGIKLISHVLDEMPTSPCVVQKYILNPYLINGKKFELRLYILVSSINPIRIYLHNDGLVLFSTHDFIDPSSLIEEASKNQGAKSQVQANINDLQMHLTNFELNKNDPAYVHNNSANDFDPKNSKWRLIQFWNYLSSKGIDIKPIQAKIEEAITKSLIVGLGAVRRGHGQVVKYRNLAFELLGADIILDSNLNPYLLELNVTPGLEGYEYPLDREVKTEIVTDSMNIARIFDNTSDQEMSTYLTYQQAYDECIMEEKERVQNVMKDQSPWNNPSLVDYTCIRELVEEDACKGNFKRIYPKRKNIISLWQYYSTWTYEDISTKHWIVLSKEERFTHLMNNWDIYLNCIEKIIQYSSQNQGHECNVL